MRKIFMYILIGSFIFFCHSTILAQKSWVKQYSPTSNLLYMPYFTDANHGSIAGQEGAILRTNDGGLNWTIQNSNSPHSLTSIYFSGTYTGVVIGASGTVLRTEDGGETWLNQNSGFYNFLTALSFPTPTTGYAAGEGGLIIKTTDGGKTWTQKPTTITSWFYGVSFVNEKIGTAVTMSGEIIRTTDGGDTWISQTSGTTNGLVGLFFTDANTGTAVGYNGTILRTVNGGSKWTAQSSGTANFLRAIYFTDSNHGIVAGENGIILKTTNGGSNWIQQGSPTNSSLIGAYMADTSSGTIVGFDGTILSLQKTNQYAITTEVNPLNGGTVTGSGYYLPGQTVTLTAVSNIYYIFKNWTVNGNIVSTDSVYKFTLTSSAHLTANFYTNRITYSVTVYSSPTAGGTVSGSGTYVSGQTVTVKAHKNKFYDFYAWTENGSTVSIDSVYQFTLQSYRNLTAVFINPVPLYNVTTLSVPGIGGRTSGGGIYPYNYSVTVSALPDSGFSFINWTEKGNVVSTSQVYQFTLTTYRTLTANFYALNRATLVINPDIAFLVSSVAGDGIIIIKNISGGSMDWRASTAVNWIKFPNTISGTNNGDLYFSYSVNDSLSRTGNIIITAPGAIYSPRTVQIYQQGSGILVTGVDSKNNIPTKFGLSQNYPNPFNPSTNLNFSIPKSSRVSLTIYNILGQQISRLVNETKSPGIYNIKWQGDNSASGVYIYRLEANPVDGSQSYNEIKKMIKLK